MSVWKLLDSISIARSLRAIARFLIVGLVFGLAYTQAPIYNSAENQNTKYLHGLAQAGRGILHEDWMASTLDPLPAFTALVRVTYQAFHSEYIFYFYYFLIFGVYVYSLMGIASYLYCIRRSWLKSLVYLALVTTTHSIGIGISGVDTDWVIQAGVAQQYILGPVFQPCNFGVFMLLSILVFLYHRPYLAVTLLALAGTMHPAYFPSVGVLTAAYVAIILFHEKNWLKAVGVGLVSSLLILPVFSYMYFTFQDTTPELARQATDIIVNDRIPHHSIPAMWLDSRGAYFQTLWVAIATVLVRRTLLFPIMGLSFGVAVLFTIVQILTSSDFLAFIAPWRISAFLVPLATGIIFGYWVSWAFTCFAQTISTHQRRVVRTSVGLLLTVVLIGSVKQTWLLFHRDETIPMMNFVRQTLQSGQTYLLPPNSYDLRKFRLYTGGPILVNLKTHPYKDVEVIEWDYRLHLATRFYRVDQDRSCDLLQNNNALGQYNITHVVVPVDMDEPRCEDLTERYRDDHYAVYSTERIVTDE